MPDDAETTSLTDQLAAYRRTLAVYLRQRADLGAAYAPPVVYNGIADARAAIARLKATLRDWGVEIEDLPDDEEPVAPEWPIDTRPRFDPATASPAERTTESLASHLYEWKIVHSTVQSLLFSTVPFEKAVYLAERQLTEDSIYYIEEMWHPQCSSKANRVLTDFDELTLISNRAIDDLYTIIGNRLIDNGIRNLQPDNREMLKSLRRYMNELLNSLRDVMIVTDRNIILIADTIKARSP